MNDWINVFTLLYEKTLQQSMIDKKLDEKEVIERNKIYNHYLDKRKEVLKTTQIKVEDNFDDIISKDSISPEQITRLNKLF